MKAKELIEKLSEIDPETEVCIMAYPSGPFVLLMETQFGTTNVFDGKVFLLKTFKTAHKQT